MAEAVRQGDWFVLPSPAWPGDSPTGEIPVQAIVGAWHVEADGTTGPFEPNPYYVPEDESLPTDPLHGILRRIANSGGNGDSDDDSDRDSGGDLDSNRDSDSAGADLAESLLSTIRDTVLEIGCDEYSQPMTATAPNGDPCVAVVTAAIHKPNVPVERWERIRGSDLPKALPDGVPAIWINPGDPAQFLLFAAAL